MEEVKVRALVDFESSLQAVTHLIRAKSLKRLYFDTSDNEVKFVEYKFELDEKTNEQRLKIGPDLVLKDLIPQTVKHLTIKFINMHEVNRICEVASQITHLELQNF